MYTVKFKNEAHNEYCKLLASGMLSELNPDLSGDWKTDELPWYVEYQRTLDTQVSPKKDYLEYCTRHENFRKNGRRWVFLDRETVEDIKTLSEVVFTECDLCKQEQGQLKLWNDN